MVQLDQVFVVQVVVVLALIHAYFLEQDYEVLFLLDEDVRGEQWLLELGYVGVCVALGLGEALLVHERMGALVLVVR